MVTFKEELINRIDNGSSNKNNVLVLEPEEVTQVLATLHLCNELDDIILSKLAEFCDTEMKRIDDIMGLLNFFVSVDRIKDSYIFFNKLYKRLMRNITVVSLSTARDLLQYVDKAQRLDEDLLKGILVSCLLKEENGKMENICDLKQLGALLSVGHIIRKRVGEEVANFFKELKMLCCSNMKGMTAEELTRLYNLLKERNLIDDLVVNLTVESLIERLKSTKATRIIAELAVELSEKSETLAKQLVLSLEKEADVTNVDYLIDICALFTRLSVKSDVFDKLSGVLANSVTEGKANKALFVAVNNGFKEELVTQIITKLPKKDIKEFELVIVMDCLRKYTGDKEAVVAYLCDISELLINHIDKVNILEFICILNCLGKYNVSSKELISKIKDIIYGSIEHFSLLQIAVLCDIVNNWKTFEKDILREHLMMLRNAKDQQELLEEVERVEEEALRAIIRRKLDEERERSQFKSFI